jgi:hypothetical protein
MQDLENIVYAENAKEHYCHGTRSSTLYLGAPVCFLLALIPKNQSNNQSAMCWLSSRTTSPDTVVTV